ncbi:uncharacterized protein BDZ99DRAFT_299017 [Mytilinidion resinicola]|uniref:Secreted protein n=1 Tax=Mytilinidion resinicola TaxID=574789 RepID=A0A6A6YMR9_9PEZI|nr:uncharacterized protein BDZ99DRAFT_299017 [Mytilinidion resinicola]KAF2809849.1 hypothetical protein BDZ99DRAFT_299017 [Mytilinidion resinicola]
MPISRQLHRLIFLVLIQPFLGLQLHLRQHLRQRIQQPHTAAHTAAHTATPAAKKRGRPPGAKDKVPRKKRQELGGKTVLSLNLRWNKRMTVQTSYDRLQLYKHV